MVHEKNKSIQRSPAVAQRVHDQFKFFTDASNLGYKTKNTHKRLALTYELFKKVNTQNDLRLGG